MSRVGALLTRDSPIQISLANLVAYSASFLTVPIIARSIGADGRGETAAALSAFVIVPTLIGLGLPLGLRRRSALSTDAPSVRAARDLIALSVVPSAVIALLFLTTVYAHADSTMQILGFLGICMAPLSVSWAVDTGVLVGLGRYRSVALIRMAQPLTSLVIVVTAGLLGLLSAPLVLAASMLSTLATQILALILCGVSLRGPRASRRELARESARYAGSAIAESASSRLDQVVTLPLIGAVAAGYYSVAAALSMLPVALGQALAADHFRLAAAASDKEAPRALERAIRESTSVVLPACLAFTLVAVPSLPVVFGAEFEASIVPFLALMPGAVAATIGFVASMLLAARSRGTTLTLLQVGCLALDMSLLLALAPTLGAIGAGVASSLAYVALLSGQAIALRCRPSWLLPTLSGFKDGLRRLLPDTRSSSEKL